MSLLSKPSDLVMDRAAAAADLISSSVVPIFKADDRELPDFEGSGVLLRVGTSHFLISAAHVFDVCADQPFLLLGGNERSPLTNRPIKTSVPTNQTRADDRIDIGFIGLTDDEVDRLGRENFLEPKDLNVYEAQSTFGQYFALGYPGKLQVRDPWKKVYKLNGAYFVTLEAEDRGYALCKFERSTQLLLSYKENQVINHAGGGAPRFKGMSGGGVWKFNALESQRPDNRPKLIAITIERPPCFGKSILTTRIELVLAALRGQHPELLSLIPPSRILRASVSIDAPSA